MIKLEPLALADALDRWALRREKVLDVLDIPAAREARALASACRDLDAWPRRAHVTELDFACVWLELRERTVKLLQRCSAAAVDLGIEGTPDSTRASDASGDRMTALDWRVRSAS